jgi:hypothetical protein
MVDTNQKHPDSTFKSEYPYNQTTITRSGHEFHINDTPGNESLKIAHTIGTYFEIDKNGRWTQVVQEKGYQYFKDGLSEVVDGHKDVLIGETLNLQVKNSMNEGVTGNRDIGIGGNFKIGTAGSRYDHIGDDYDETVGGNHVSQIDGSEYNSIGKNLVTSVGGTKVDQLASDWAVTSSGNIGIVNTNGVFRIKCKQFIVEAEVVTITTISGDITITSAANVTTINAGVYTINSAGNIEITAPRIDII